MIISFLKMKFRIKKSILHHFLNGMVLEIILKFKRSLACNGTHDAFIKRADGMINRTGRYLFDLQWLHKFGAV